MYGLELGQTSRTKTLLDSYRRSRNGQKTTIGGYLGKLQTEIETRPSASDSRHRLSLLAKPVTITFGDMTGKVGLSGKLFDQENSLGRLSTRNDAPKEPMTGIQFKPTIPSTRIQGITPQELSFGDKSSNIGHRLTSELPKHISQSSRLVPTLGNTGLSMDKQIQQREKSLPSASHPRQSLKELNEVFKSRRMNSSRDSLRGATTTNDGGTQTNISDEVSVLLGMSITERTKCTSKLNLAHDLKVTSFFKHFEERQKSREISKDKEKIDYKVPNHVRSPALLTSNKANNTLASTFERQALQSSLARRIVQVNTEASDLQEKHKLLMISRPQLQEAIESKQLPIQPKAMHLSNLLVRRPVQLGQGLSPARNLAGSPLLSSHTNLLDLAAKSKEGLRVIDGPSQLMNSGIILKAAASSTMKDLFKLPSGDSTSRTARTLKNRSQMISELNSMYDSKDKEIQARSIERISRIRSKLVGSS